MRAFFKQLLKGRGTPVLQARNGDGETILSAGNIWTSAHARRIELRENGLAPGDALCCAPMGSFQAAIDFVACAIGGFVYVPVEADRAAALLDDVAKMRAATRRGILFCDSQGGIECHHSRLPACLAAKLPEPGALLALPPAADADSSPFRIFTADAIENAVARLTHDLGTPSGGTRLTMRSSHGDAGFVADLLLGLCNRKTIYLRAETTSGASETLSEALDLEVDDLVLSPASIESFAEASGRLGERQSAGLARIRLHTGGEAISARQREIASSLFGKVLVEPVGAALCPVGQLKADRSG